MTRLGLLTLGLLASTGVLAAVALLRAGRPDAFALDHGGWQVTVAEVLVGLIGAALLLGCWTGLQRAWASRSRHGRAVVLAAVLPGAALGVGGAAGVTELVHVAADHTSAAAAGGVPAVADGPVPQRQPRLPDPQPPAPRPRAVGSTPVVFKRYGTSLAATFVVKEHYVSLRLLTFQHPTRSVTTGTPSDPVLFDRLVQAAVSRAGA